MTKRVKIGTGSCGLAAGAGDVLKVLRAEFPELIVEEVGCLGHCYAEPLIEVETEGGSFYFGEVKADKDYLQRVINIDKSITTDFSESRVDLECLKVTALVGKIPPTDINRYIENGGYDALRKALSMVPEEVVNEVKESGLRGRGGGGFPTGLKWSFLAAKDAERKIVVCNADEGDPGAFMDRSLMESVPHQVLEGMLICAYATGATELIIYCRAEYPMAIAHLDIAIKSIETHGLNKFADRTVSIRIKEGAGAFVCGEETALIHSLEGKRGMPRFRPPFPTDSGYLGFPTMINNVETFGNIPVLVREGAEAFASVGTEKSKGTKIFALAGDVKYPGLVEVPMGITLKEIVYDIGGVDPNQVKAVQTGGPSGGCIPAELFDTPVDYDSLNSLGAIMGSGGLIVIGKNRCMVETSRYFLDFTHRESCGKCTFCRVGTKRMFETLERITDGEGTPEDIDFLEDISPKIKAGSLCGLGQTAPNPVLATLRYFRDEFEAHVIDKNCPALECNALVNVNIDLKNCIKCRLCIKNCAVNAISDGFVVDNDVCTRCNSCIEVCPRSCIARTEGKQ